MSGQLSFYRGALIAALLSLVGAVTVAGLSVVMTGSSALITMVILVAGAYLLNLLRCSEHRVGRVAVFATWLLLTVAGVLFNADLAFTVVTQVVAISVVRSLYFHSSLISGLLDLLLSGLALAAAVWAAQSGSLVLTLWSFFLVQALFTGIPTFRPRRFKNRRQIEDEFDRAHRAALGALNRIVSQR